MFNKMVTIEIAHLVIKYAFPMDFTKQILPQNQKIPLCRGERSFATGPIRWGSSVTSGPWDESKRPPPKKTWEMDMHLDYHPQRSKMAGFFETFLE